MSEAIEISDGPYHARILSGMVEVFFLNELIDNPGPWDTDQAALNWASLIIAKYASEGHGN